MHDHIATLTSGRTGRRSSWDTTGRNRDVWAIAPGETRVLADIEGPGAITHLWLTQRNHYRECLLRITWDDAPHASVLAPLGDFFCLGHGIVNSFQSALFTASTAHDNRFEKGCALNCYAPMPFRRRALVEMVNESGEEHLQYFYVDYERLPEPRADAGYFHAEFRRANPFGGWGHEIAVNTPEANIVNRARTAWENNYVILETQGRGHYLGCNLSVTNFQGTWWGEGDDMSGSTATGGHPTCTAPAARTTSIRRGACRTTPSSATDHRYSRTTPAAIRPVTCSIWRTRCASARKSR